MGTKKIFIIPLIIVAIVVFVIFLLIFWTNSWGAAERQKIFKASHSEILSSCREMINNRHNYRNDRSDINAKPGDPVVLKAKGGLQDQSVQKVIREMNPKYIALYEDHALICFSALPRIYIIAFKDGAEQYGSKKIIDGLWYWNGRHYKKSFLE